MAAVLFLHGLESNPNGSKARWLKAHFDVAVPALHTADFKVALGQAREAVAAERPNVVVGSSFGGALLLALVQEGAWQGACLFIAQAGQKLGLEGRLPVGTRAVVVHGDADDVVPVADSRALAASGGDGVELVEIEGGDHRLMRILEDGTLHALLARLLSEP